MKTKKSEFIEFELQRKLEIIRNEINDLQTNYYDKLLYGEHKEVLQDVAKKSSNFMEMLKYANAEVLEKIVKYKIYNSSPYSLSIYSGEKSWFYTENNSYSISDHWNFSSRGKMHKLTTIPLDEVIKIKFEDCKNQNDYYYFCQFRNENKPYIKDSQYEIQEVGAWQVIDVWEKDFEKYRTLNEISIKLFELKEKEKKLIKKQLKNEFEQISENLRKKIAEGEIWGKIYMGDKVYQGHIDNYSKGVMTINGVASKNYVFIFTNLTEKEQSVLLCNYLADETGTVGYNGKFNLNNN